MNEAATLFIVLIVSGFTGYWFMAYMMIAEHNNNKQGNKDDERN